MAREERIISLSGQVKAFAEACYDQNSVEELKEAIDVDDPTDCRTWDITELERRQAIGAALHDLLLRQAHP